MVSSLHAPGSNMTESKRTLLQRYVQIGVVVAAYWFISITLGRLFGVHCVLCNFTVCRVVNYLNFVNFCSVCEQ